MAWMKRRGQATPSPAAAPPPNPVQMYNPSQHSNQEGKWQQQDSSWYNQVQPKQVYDYNQGQQPQQNFWQPPYTQTAPQNYPQNTQYQQPLQNQSYYQPGYQNHGNGQFNAAPQYNYNETQNNAYGPPKQVEGDTWNWGWGDEDNSNVQLQSNSNINLNQQTIANSFANDESWNWSVDDSNSTASLNNPKTDVLSNTPSQTSLNNPSSEEAFPKVVRVVKKHMEDDNSEKHHKHELLDNLPPSRLGKPRKIDHLTPQWSTESQMSQESSDDVLHTSESDKILSRSSTVSQSPISGQDPVAEYQEQPNNLQPLMEDINTYYRQDLECSEDKTLAHHENSEVLSSTRAKSGGLPSSLLVKSPPPSKALPVASASYKANPTAPPAVKNATPPLEDFKNPYKRTTDLPHKTTNKFKTKPEETLPDNSEQPDVLPHPVHKMTAGKPPQPDNNEVAPMNDRNQYLETGQLSDENTNMQHENPDTLPPPGLRRMVLGQIEQNESSATVTNDNFGDEPPPGLSRMVLGQTESNSSLSANVNLQEIELSLPVGLHRMIPGESSPPETSLQYQPNDRIEDFNSDPELNQIHHATPQQRSATIGADTPPVVSKSATSQSQRETNLDGANSSDPTQTSDVRRETTEGQHDLHALVRSVRDLTVGENPTDATPTNSNQEARKPQPESDSDHEHVRGKSPRDARDHREHRYKDKNESREKYRRERYSPDSYRDRKVDKRRYRDRRYEDDTEDYYSDRERDRRRQERDDYERKYASLRRDKEKERHRRDMKDGRRDYYYNRYQDDYEDNSRSRPSSRSDSMHDSYHERSHDKRRHREQPPRRHREHREREPFNPYMQGYQFDPYSSYYQQYHRYYENLRRTNPQAYADMYRKYYQNHGALGGAAATAAYSGEDRASVHSGRSSANDELAKDRYSRQCYYSQSSLSHHVSGYYRDSHSISGQYGLDETSYSRPFDQTDSSLLFEDQTTVSQRLTPAKYATAHVKATINSGQLVKIVPSYPLDGQPASVELCDLQSFLRYDDELQELTEFPGPLIKGVTHKKTIIEYCENKIKNVAYNGDIVDVESYILMWELLILLLRQNGMVVGTDIAELLMKNRGAISIARPASVASISSSGVAADEPSETSNAPASEASNSSNTGLKEEVVTNKFREYLIYGSGKEALEWAMKHGLWGHALFLASKLDKRTYANVMMRFANGLTMNDPLQTLYQLLSGRMPASVTSVLDDKWGDWRPHLAMILSNTSQRPELDRKAITTLADTLFNRGSIYAAQFCYLMAQVGFSRYGSEGSKLVLLGSNQNKPFRHFSTNEAICMTEVYEYACKLNDNSFVIPEFQAYKYILSTRLADRGLLEKSLSYLEQIADAILQNPAAVDPSLVNRVCELADRLKYHDPVGDDDEVHFEGDFDSSRPDNSWLKDLKQIQHDFNIGLITHESLTNLPVETPELEPTQSQQPSYVEQVPPQDPWQQYQQTNLQQWQSEQQIEQQPVQLQENLQESYNNQFHEQPALWGQQQWTENSNDQVVNQYQQQEHQIEQQQPNNYWNGAQIEQDEVEKEPTEDTPAPQISMPNQSSNRYGEEETETKHDSPAKAKKSPVKQEKPATAGWFGGIWNRLALRPKNQMKLPDDKNPSIVWDPEKKRWVNLDEEGTEGSSELKPPPKMADMFPKAVPNFEQQQQSQHQHLPPNPVPVIPNQSAVASQVPAQNNPMPTVGGHKEDAPPPKPSQPNMFKLQRGRNLKKSYVDVFNPGGKSSSTGSLPIPASFDPFPGAPGGGGGGGTKMNLFVPQPFADTNAPIDFLTPSTDASQMSRWSSASSLSREVQFYMRHKQPIPH